MNKKLEQERASALHRVLAGEKIASVCASLGRSRSWLYKWLSRYSPTDVDWYKSRSKRPNTNPRRVSSDIEAIVMIVRENLAIQNLFCGDQAIRWEMEHMGIEPLPSLRTINRILERSDTPRRRKGGYEPKGKRYPQLPAFFPNQTQQVDLVGPCYLKSPVRFYSLNVIDVAINRCGIQPLKCRAAQHVINGIWSIWQRLGIPCNLQADNEMSFYGSPTHPRGMGPLIRLCLLCGVELWFIPSGEPWRNGVIEKFNDHYRQKFLSKVLIESEQELETASLDYEHKHNSKYRYSKIKGQTPLNALNHFGHKLIFPEGKQAPKHPLKKTELGRYHLVRFIRSDRRLNIFGELFPAPPETQYEYVVATIDVKEQKLKLFLAQKQVEEYKYQLRPSA